MQERFKKSGRKWKRSDHHALVGRVNCGCCGHNLRHSTGVGQPHYWCPGLNIYHMDGCVKRIEDFYLEEVILFQIQQNIMELGESDKLLQAEKEAAAAEAEANNNIEKFEDDFRFQLTAEETADLRSKYLTANINPKSRYDPYVFTETGIYMLMTVLIGELATRQSKALIRTFKQMKDYLSHDPLLLQPALRLR